MLYTLSIEHKLYRFCTPGPLPMRLRLWLRQRQRLWQQLRLGLQHNKNHLIPGGAFTAGGPAGPCGGPGGLCCAAPTDGVAGGGPAGESRDGPTAA